MRVRPAINLADTEFEVFIKLSFASDSDQLFERMLSMLPLTGHHFFTNDDAWGAELWDIEPTCQVAALDESSVLIDGLRGAQIRWKSFKRVAYLNRFGWGRYFAAKALQFNLLIFLITVLLFHFNPAIFPLLILSLLLWAFAGPLVRKIYGGKVWGAQAWLFGFEGYMDIATIEAMIFGSHQGRLSWGIASSSLSRHRKDETGHCVGVDPITDQGTRNLIANAARSGVNDVKVFTLVDTGSMTVTMFTARCPPTVLLVTGVEGGMQRAVLCSYEWKTGTMFRESVIRMETTSLDNVSRVPRIKFGFRRPEVPTDMYIPTSSLVF